MKLRRLLLPATFGVAAYFALFGGERSALEAWRLDQQREREAAELARLQAEVEELRAWADSLESDSVTLERLARERFGMIREGERLYRFAPPSTLDPDSVGGEGELEP